MNAKNQIQTLRLLLLFLFKLATTTEACNITLTTCKVTSWPANSWSVSSHASPLGFFKRRWFGRCTKQISDLKEMMNHGEISICSCISTINAVCELNTPFIYGVCISDLCNKQSQHDNLKKQVSPGSKSNKNNINNKNSATSSVIITNTPPTEHKTYIYKNIIYGAITVFTIILFYIMWFQCKNLAVCINRWTPMAQQATQSAGFNNKALTSDENNIELASNKLPTYNSQRKPISTEIELN
jgi:hypothetical protein